MPELQSVFSHPQIGKVGVIGKVSKVFKEIYENSGLQPSPQLKIKGVRFCCLFLQCVRPSLCYFRRRDRLLKNQKNARSLVGLDGLFTLKFRNCYKRILVAESSTKETTKQRKLKVKY